MAPYPLGLRYQRKIVKSLLASTIDDDSVWCSSWHRDGDDSASERLGGDHASERHARRVVCGSLGGHGHGWKANTEDCGHEGGSWMEKAGKKHRDGCEHPQRTTSPVKVALGMAGLHPRYASRSLRVGASSKGCSLVAP